MASTMTAGQALDIVSMRYKGLQQEGFGPRFADEVQAYIWYRFPWRQSLSELPPFHPVLEEPDYGPPTSAVPPDFYGFHDVWLRYRDGSTKTLTPMKDLAVSPVAGIPEAISYQAERYSFRLYPRPSITAPEWWVEGIYKKTPTKITTANVNSYLIPWDDLYFAVFRQGLIWKVKDEILGDPAAPGEFAKFETFVQRMAAAEGMQLGVTIVHPHSGLELGG